MKASPNGMSASPLGIRAALDMLGDGEITPVDLVRNAIDRAQLVNPRVNAFAAVAGERALRDAVDSGVRWDEDRARPLEGIPIAVKDLFDTDDMEASYGSAAYKNHFPSADAELVRQLRHQGAIIVGKTTTHEFAWGVTTASTHFGDTCNPVDEARIPGGSSGGAAAAIASGVVAAGLGTDTGGSVRIPAALCGTVGYKPTFGRLSTSGIFPFSPSLDHAGILGATVDDVMLLASALGIDSPATPQGRKTKLGVLRSIPPVPLDAAVTEAFHAGVISIANAYDTVEIDHAGTFEGVFAAFAGIVLTEGSVGHYMRNSKEKIEADYEPETRERIERARNVCISDYFDHQDFRRSFTKRLDDFMDKIDFLVLPTTPCVAPLRGQESVQIGSWSGTVREALMTYAAPFNMAGFPAISIPLAVPPGALPCGLQIVGRRGQDAALLRLAADISSVMVAVGKKI
ncbi:amidase [Ensifer adhaerens]|uniref:amidase n=1 Tax=Ensifer adhaerens TaxID=106592 RepID=UPI001CBC4B91|nr:amidase [Ensifer adhaerens]MBZ7924840.1 amidase [Ensifer adhaerens]UAX95942.1 amidase [Ensifer adhaerens]UAY04716.1 amidase [Ensifer adhaerens]UAY10147.1 amidase [Ensifer adhaerens]